MEVGSGMCAIVEHPVLFKMPRLSTNEKLEKDILDSLDDLKDKFPDLISLSTGRLLRDVHGCTHAIFVRFPSHESLIEYYSSQALMDVIMKMLPALSGEYVVDYNCVTKSHLKTEHGSNPVHICFWKFKDGTSDETVENVMDSINKLVEDIPSIVLQITAGTNNYLRDKTFSNAFVARLSKSENVVEDLYAHPSYLKLMETQIIPNSEKSISTDFIPHTFSRTSVDSSGKDMQANL